MEPSAPRDALLGNLRGMLRSLFVVREQGVSHARIARAHGYTDGFMKALVQAGIASERELLGIVQEERRKVAGPATRTVATDSAPPGSASPAANAATASHAPPAPPSTPPEADDDIVIIDSVMTELAPRRS